MKKIIWILSILFLTIIFSSASLNYDYFINGAGRRERYYKHDRYNYNDHHRRNTGCNVQRFEWGDDSSISLVPGSPKASEWINKKIAELGIFRFERNYEESETYRSGWN